MRRALPLVPAPLRAAATPRLPVHSRRARYPRAISRPQAHSPRPAPREPLLMLAPAAQLLRSRLHRRDPLLRLTRAHSSQPLQLLPPRARLIRAQLPAAARLLTRARPVPTKVLLAPIKALPAPIRV